MRSNIQCRMKFSHVVVLSLLGVAYWVTLYKIHLIANSFSACVILGKCDPYMIYPWSRVGIVSNSSLLWLLIHILVASANMGSSAFRIIFFGDENKTLDGWALQLNRVFCALVLLNFWNFANFHWLLASFLNLLPVVMIYYTYNVDSRKDYAIYMRWANFITMWLAPGLEIAQYLFL